ncbi:MAG: YihY/virulence factor BrkB family protein [Acidimicrobiales bacterium]
MVEPPAEHGSPNGRWRRARSGLAGWTDRVDAFQQRHRVTALAVAVVRKFSDDQGGRLAGQIAYSSFLAVFPLLLLLLAVLGLVLHGDTHAQNEILNSAVRQFPVVGADLTDNVRQLSTGSNPGVYLVLLWLVYGSLRLSRSAQAMMAVVWGVARHDLPGFRHWLPRAVGFLAVLGVGFVGGGALAGLGAFHGLGYLSEWIGLVGIVAVNVTMFWCGFTILVTVPPGDRLTWPGAVVAGVLWSVMQFVGAELVSHQLRPLSSLYGTFATVLGLMWWLALGTTVAVLAAECNVVLARRLWPRSLRRARSAADAEPPREPEPAESAGPS